MPSSRERQVPLERPRRSSEMRDAGLDLVRRANRWLIVGAVAGSGLLALVAKGTLHGRTVRAGATGSKPSGAQAGPSSSGEDASPSSDGAVAPSSGGAAAPQPPAQPPAPAPAGPDAAAGSSAPGPAISGGS